MRTLDVKKHYNSDIIPMYKKLKFDITSSIDLSSRTFMFGNSFHNGPNDIIVRAIIFF